MVGSFIQSPLKGIPKGLSKALYEVIENHCKGMSKAPPKALGHSKASQKDLKMFLKELKLNWLPTIFTKSPINKWMDSLPKTKGNP